MYKVVYHNAAWLRTEQKRFGRKMVRIVEFSIFDGKWNSQFLMEFGVFYGKQENGQKIAEKMSNSFTFIGFTVMFIQFV